ncbi:MULTISPECIES: DUF2333 family protein [Cobetia]|uniref:DUF2333 family protein n=1 Tax=Cobetia crustatorum TaxID=553385 RepID=A0A558HXG3_9GAMM|nr:MULTISPECIES: DUF2333 family protein [Cobetia]TVU73822.1 DUF2333 family protein [Cobetia crustatorum]
MALFGKGSKSSAGRDVLETPQYGWIWKPLVGLFIIYLLVCVGLGIYWSTEPDEFNVDQATRTELARVHGLAVPEASVDGESVAPAFETLPTGTATVATLMKLNDTLLHKPGGYLKNDIAPPGLWLDNMPNWEYGVLVQIRDMTREMRKEFSRSQSQSSDDKALGKAESLLFIDANAWMLPKAESEYADANRQLGDYLKRLSDDTQNNGQFYARADNLVAWLSDVENRLGSLSQRLSASVGKSQLNLSLAGDKNATSAKNTETEEEIKTPWLEIDDVFYQARGTSWALIHLLKAVRHDFHGVLEDKNALTSIDQIIRELESTQTDIGSPVILNGSGFGFFANHSLVMANYVARANSAISDLRSLLENG